MAHLKLMKEDDTTIQDSEHELYVYKVRNRRRGRRGGGKEGRGGEREGGSEEGKGGGGGRGEEGRGE